jgi:hypothetical protein
MSHSPTFVAVFSDGVNTRVPTWHYPTAESFDLIHGFRNSRPAYESRAKQKPPPLLSEGHFECDGAALQAYTAAELNAADRGKS